MKVFKGEDITSGAAGKLLGGGSSITIGNFDGVHLGHRKILDLLRQRASELKVPSVVMTFDPHPRKVLSSPGIKLITNSTVKCRILDMLDIDYLLIVAFSREFAAQSPLDFIEQWLMPVSPRAVVVGYDFNFGRGGAGSFDVLEKEGKEHGFSVEKVEAYRVDGTAISSSRIRNLIEGGEVSMSEKFLGRPYAVFGQVIKGHGRGRRLGFPTANFDVGAELLPCDGVYAGEVVIENQVLPSMINIGPNPTFEDMARSVEACILDFDEDIYGRDLEVRFRDRIRSEVKFPNAEALVEQINRDRKIIEHFFQMFGASPPLGISSDRKST